MFGSTWEGSSQVLGQSHEGDKGAVHFEVQLFVGGGLPYLREGTVVPDVAVVRKAVVHKAQLVLLHVLLNGVEWFRRADLKGRNDLQQVYE